MLKGTKGLRKRRAVACSGAVAGPKGIREASGRWECSGPRGGRRDRLDEKGLVLGMQAALARRGAGRGRGEGQEAMTQAHPGPYRQDVPGCASRVAA